MCGKNFGDRECSKFEEVKRKLENLEKLKQQLLEANRKLLERSKLIKTELRQDFLDSFSLLWKKKKRFWEHVQTRIDRGHLPDIGKEEAAFLYARQIMKVLAAHGKIVVERGKIYRQQTFLQSGSWIVVINDRGRIETAFPVTIGLKRWLESHKLIDEALEVADYEADKKVRETFERILRRIEKI